MARGPGRPTIFSDDLEDTILSRITVGESLRHILSTKGMPDMRTVFRWINEKPDFAAKYARARELQADAMDDKILHVADNCTGETALADRVKIAAYQWRASKLAPKKYGDKLQLGGDPTGVPITIVSGVPRADD